MVLLERERKRVVVVVVGYMVIRCRFLKGKPVANNITETELIDLGADISHFTAKGNTLFISVEPTISTVFGSLT